MSDRRPPNPDYLTERSRKAVTPDELQERLAFFDELGVDWQYRNVPEFMFDFVAAARDPVAVVRRGVESGTIKGEVVLWCSTHRCAYNDGAPGCDVWLAAREGGALHPKPCVINQFSEVLVIPVEEEKA